MTDASEGGSESTWARPTRRRVVQWGIVYVAGAWGFLQGLQYLSGTCDWPRQISWGCCPLRTLRRGAIQYTVA